MTLLTDLLGTSCFALSLAAQLPQMLQILAQGSVAGLSFSAYILDLCSLTIKLMYHTLHGYALLTYSPTIVYTVQGYAIVILLLWYDRANRSPTKLAQLSVCLGCLLLIPTNLLPTSLINTLMKGSLAFSVSNKAAHLQKIAACMERPVVDPAQWIIYTYISMVGLYTALVEQGDSILAFQHIVTSFLNMVVFGLLLHKRKQGGKQE